MNRKPNIWETLIVMEVKRERKSMKKMEKNHTFLTDW